MAGTTARGELLKPTDAESADVAVLNANFDKLSDYAVGDFLCTSTTRPAAPWQGMRIYETDTGACLIRLGTAWKPTNRIICTKATRPSNPVVGQEIFETDTGLQYIWNGTLWFYIGGELVGLPSVSTYGEFSFASAKRLNNAVIGNYSITPPFKADIIYTLFSTVGFSTAQAATKVSPSKTAGSGVLTVATDLSVGSAPGYSADLNRLFRIASAPADEVHTIRLTHGCTTTDSAGSYSGGVLQWRLAPRWS